MPMSYTRVSLFILVSCICFASSTFSQDKKTIPPQRDTSKTVILTSPAPPKKGPRPYREIIPATARSVRGLFAVHQVDDKWFMEIGDTLLNRDILIVNRISKAPANTRSGVFGYAGDEINQNVIRFEKGPANKLFLRTISYSVYARDTAGAMYKSVMNSNIQPITAAFDVKALSSDTTGSVIEMTDMLNSDNEVFFFSNSVKSSLQLGGLQSDKSYIVDIKPYPINTEIRTVKTYTRGSRTPITGSSSAGPHGYATFELNSSMVLLPSTLMRPRYFDDRVAYFTTEFTDYDIDPQGVKDVSLITKWRLEPKPEELEKFRKGELVEPVKPIVFYIDPATPKKWVPYLIQGVNDWQKAFEKAGFKNAIIGREAPTSEEDPTWSLEDARYSAIVYKPSNIPNASGPHIHDPRTGEILESHINWYHNVTSLLHSWYLIQAGASDPRARKPSFSDSLMGQLIRFVSSHEVGHTLGLPHNMGSSFATPVEKLRDKKWTAVNGHTASIMDYARFNYVAQPEDSIAQDGIFPRIGEYDIWAIEWGYKAFPGKTEKEERKLLNDWVKKNYANPRLRYIHMDGSDPRAQSEDLGDNAMKAGTYGIKNLKRILPQLPEWVNVEGENFDKLKNIYQELLNQYSRYIGHVITNVGGVYSDAKTSDQAGAVYRPVPRSTQKEAMNFLRTNLFATPNWLLNNKILDVTSAPGPDPISSLQDEKLNSLLATSRLQRILSSESRFKNVYSLDEYMTDLRNAIWSELKTNKPVDPYRRSLQKAYVEKIAGLTNPRGPSFSGPGITIMIGPVTDPRKSDMVSIAKAQLRILQGQIAKALPLTSDRMTRYHLMDVGDRIEKALDVDD